MTRNIQQIIFGGAIDIEAQDSVDQVLDGINEEQLQSGKTNTWPSAYVDIFEETVNIVIKNDIHLLSKQEQDVLEAFTRLSYNARYCLIRLVLRKPKQWYAVDSLEAYEKEIGKDGVADAVGTLCNPIEVILQNDTALTPDALITAKPLDSFKRNREAPSIVIKQEEGREIIDLSLDSDEDEECSPNELLSTSALPTNSCVPEMRDPTPEERIQEILNHSLEDTDLGWFCEDESKMTLQEALHRLSKDQVVHLVKMMKCKAHASTKKQDLISTLCRNAVKQSVLNFDTTPRRTKGKAKDNRLRHSQLPSPTIPKKSNSRKFMTSQEKRLKQIALNLLGKCVRVNYDFWLLVRRLHIICYRETELPTALLLPALLTRFKKRHYSLYNYARSKDIWPSRQEYLLYEQSLELNQAIDEIVEEEVQRSKSKTPAPQQHKFATLPRTEGRHSATPLEPFGSSRDIHTLSIKKEETPVENDAMQDIVTSEIVLTKDYRLKKHLESWIYPKWKEHITAETARNGPTKAPGLERFYSGYVYTRMVQKAGASLTALKEHALYLEVAECFLSQRFWRRGKRAWWYDRRAILQGHLYRQTDDKHKKRDLLWQTLEGIKEALLDEDTGTVWRPSLVKRLIKLENQLKLPESDRSICEGELRSAKTVEIWATRVDRLKLDKFGRPIDKKENGGEVGLYAYISVIKKPIDVKPEDASHKKGFGKSSWVGRGGEHVNVETKALQHYEDQGFSGFHCETRILTTIFGLLCWDIIFADVPGAFETPFQAAPLDIHEDSFYFSRKDLIVARIEEIRSGKWPEILSKHEDAYREKQTGCIGVHWDLCSREDFLDIFESIGSSSLAMICQLFCEDYKGRSSGGPDLFVWRRKEKSCKFVEVKGPGDRPQENQKYWFDSLLRANVQVEICYVKDDQEDKTATGGSKKRKINRSTRRKLRDQGSPNEEEDYDRLDLTSDNDAATMEGPNAPPKKRSRSSRDTLLSCEVEATGECEVLSNRPRPVPASASISQ